MSLPVPSEAGLTLGQQQLDAGDLVLPRVKPVQQMSVEAQGGKNARATPGDWWNTLTQENLGTELTVVPILTYKQRVMFLRQNTRNEVNDALVAAGEQPVEGDGLICRSFDMIHGVGSPGIECEVCPLSQWRGAQTPPLCSETYNVAGLSGTGELIILSFRKSSAKTGKQFFSMLRLTSQAPWTKQYKVTTREVTNDQGTFFVPQVVPDGPPVEELAREAARWYPVLGGAQAITVAGDEDEEGGASTHTDDF